jgi:hypothetical protein
MVGPISVRWKASAHRRRLTGRASLVRARRRFILPKASADEYGHRSVFLLGSLAAVMAGDV